ncbi:Spy/CpxP family protein refolding chaperone [Paeniroseomonas aquatica]|uniref:Spy/CpxP family protein refolding chaperone n=1 Tax=Paeniroseomonas aquatica TaxID=373043 RepID=A0ABT8A1I6_9PROT|nr:Spy/CpxP family protein refolding chaperone [Paeniroseomonas aquatica]MDN3563572.1 Spy/CpxP family protein refolding chaperone [Paeniroseomonas aquatica]
MAECPMMGMMRDMMRSGAMPQGMQGGAAAGMGAMGNGPPTGSSAARLEGRIAFLRMELRITDVQAPAWDTFASTLRAGREHLDAARAALQDSGTAADPMARLTSFESHLRERTEAIHMTRMAFGNLYGLFDDAQKRTATATMLPFIGAF